MSRIGPELTDQRYCVWGAIRTSGAIATVLGACIMLYPASRVLTFGGRVVGPGRAELAAAIVALVLRQDQLQMPLAEDQHPVGDLSRAGCAAGSSRPQYRRRPALRQTMR